MNVVIRGHVRTWMLCKHNTFQQFPNAMFHFITWNESITWDILQQLHEDFAPYPHRIYIVPRPTHITSSWQSQRYLTQVLKQQELSGMVMEMRPDSWVTVHDALPDVPGLYVTELEQRMELMKTSSGYTREMKLRCQDAGLYMDVNTMHLLSDAYQVNREMQGPRVQLLEYAQQQNIPIHDANKYFSVNIIRPNFQGVIENHEKHWMGLSRQAKLHHLQQLNIMEQDYITEHRAISL